MLRIRFITVVKFKERPHGPSLLVANKMMIWQGAIGSKEDYVYIVEVVGAFDPRVRRQLKFFLILTLIVVSS